MLVATTIGDLLHPAVLPCDPRPGGARRGGGGHRSRDAASPSRSAPLLAGCAVGPGYHPEPVVPAIGQVGAARRSDSTRTFFDSLAAARAADSARPPGVAPVPPRRLDRGLARRPRLARHPARHDADAAGRDRVAAEPRPGRSPGADPRVPRRRPAWRAGRCSRASRRTAARARNKIVLGAFPPVEYNAWRVTADAAWELDFWGRIRRGMQAAGADLAAQQAAAQAAVLSLVSDVASGYLRAARARPGAGDRRADARRPASATLDLARRRYAAGCHLRAGRAAVRGAGGGAGGATRPGRAAARRTGARAERAARRRCRCRSRAAASLRPRRARWSCPTRFPPTLLARRPDVRQAEREYAAATARIGVAVAARLPTFMITGSYGSQAANDRRPVRRADATSISCRRRSRSRCSPAAGW